MYDEQSKPTMQKSVIGALKMPGNVPPIKSTENNKPKLGFGIDLTKAKDI